MAEERIRALNYNVEEIGKYMKSSKKRFEWVLGLTTKTHTIILDFSFISGKVKVMVDGRVILENEIPVNTSFQYPFTLDGFALNLIQQGQNCELRINNKVFSHLYIQEKTEQEFKHEEGEFEIKPDKEFMSKLNKQNKITLDIGNAKKFKKNNNDDGEWGAFAGIGLPPGFEQPPGTEEATVTHTPTQDIHSGKGPGVDFFADEDQQQSFPTPLLEKPLEVVQPQKPAEMDIQSLYSQPNTTNQFYTQIPASLNFTGPSQFQTSGVQLQPSQPSLYSTSNLAPLPPSNLPQSSNLTDLNFGTSQNQVPQPALNFQTGFQTTGLGLNHLYQTSNNLQNVSFGYNNPIPNINSLTSGLDHLDINPPQQDNFFQQANFQPAEQEIQQPKADPFGGLESLAIQSNFNTTSVSASAPPVTNFLTQSPSLAQSIDLL